MKQKILYLITLISLFFTSTVTVFAADSTAESAKFNWYFVWNSFRNSKAAFTVGIIVLVVVLLFAVFGKKFTKKLNNSTSSQMVNTFIAVYSVFGIASLAMAFATDGVTWSNLMFKELNPDLYNPQFSDYIHSVCLAGRQDYSALAGNNTPFAILVFFLLSKFLPPDYIKNESTIIYQYILKNQVFMYLYLILVMLCIVLIYRMNRSVLRQNTLRLRDEIIVFLMVVSYPTMYEVERGNILGLSLVLSLFFIIYHNSESTYTREMSHIALGVASAITPITILFLVFMAKKDKKSILNCVKIIVYSLILHLASSIIVGFDNLWLFIQNFAGIQSETFTASNMSIANLMLFAGVTSKGAIIAVTIIMNVIAVAAAVILPTPWQKLTAIVYIMLNVFSCSVPTTLIFIFIPFAFLLAEKEHKAVHWLYLLCFMLLIIPFPEWFWFDKSNFNIFMSSVGIKNIGNANNLISLAAVQSLFVILFSQTAKKLFTKKDKI